VEIGWLSVGATAISSAVTVGFLYGVTKTQTKYLEKAIDGLKEALRHHVQSEHPRLALEAREHEREIASLKAKGWRQSQIDRGEHER
jgi:hypothetical protein